MESGSIELKIISCNDLRAFNFFQKLSVYALVSISSDDPDHKLENRQRQEQRSPIDRDGDGNPEWNHQMRFNLDGELFQKSRRLFLHFDLRSEGLLVFGDKTIGEVRVPFTDLVEDHASSNGAVRFVRYEVRNSDGKPNGILNFSFKVNVKGKERARDSCVAAAISGYSVVVRHHQQEQVQQSFPEINRPPTAAIKDSEVHYPSLELQDLESHYPSVELQNHEVHHPLGELQNHEVHYPSLELQDHSQPSWPQPQHFQHISHENYYVPPDFYYGPQPLPPPPQPLPLPHPWAFQRHDFAGGRINSMHTAEAPARGSLQPFDRRVIWPNGY